MRYSFCIVIWIVWVSALEAQSNRLGAFSLTDGQQSSRTAAMGGYASAVHGDDTHVQLFNPAALNSAMHGRASISQVLHLGGIRYGSVSYAHHMDGSRYTFGGAISYIDFGDFNRTLVDRQVTGRFTGGQVSLSLSGSAQLTERLRLGVSLRGLSSRLAEYSSTGLMADIGLQSYSADKQTTWSIVILNAGTQLSTYKATRESIPLELRIGWSKRLKHLPFLITITAHDLDRWHLESITRSSTAARRAPVVSFIDDLFRHVAIGGELRLGKRELIHIRVGYDHQRNKELSNGIYRGFEGLSYGVGIGGKVLRVDYSLSTYHLAGSVHHMSISLDMANLLRRF